MEEMRTKLASEGFTSDQIEEIVSGMQEGIDTSVYEKTELLAIQMRQSDPSRA